MKKSIYITSFILVITNIQAQKVKLEVRPTISWVTNYVINEGFSNGAIANQSRIGGSIGFGINRVLFKKFSIDMESGYALSGHRVKIKTTTINIDKIFNVHQIYAAAGIHFSIASDIRLGAGLHFDNSFSDQVTNKQNFGYNINSYYSIGKVGFGLKMTNYFTSFRNISSTDKQYWRIYSICLTYLLNSK